AWSLKLPKRTAKWKRQKSRLNERKRAKKTRSPSERNRQNDEKRLFESPSRLGTRGGWLDVSRRGSSVRIACSNGGRSSGVGGERGVGAAQGEGEAPVSLHRSDLERGRLPYRTRKDRGGARSLGSTVRGAHGRGWPIF